MSYSQLQQQKKGGNEPWRNKERHYCAVCNAWMGSDRQSIMLHENGKKHKENVEKDLVNRRDEKKKKEKNKKDLDNVFASINAAVGGGGGSTTANFGSAKPWETLTQQCVQVQSVPTAQQPIKKESKPKLPIKVTSSSTTKPKVPTKPVFNPNVGHYELEGITYLEGKTYAKVLEEGMPIQLWLGSYTATDEEKRDLRNYNHWKKMALLAKVVKKRGSAGDEDDVKITCHVSYLLNATDEEETLESNVLPSRIRLVLGSDPLIPSTMEEAHLALMGGEQTIQVNNDGDKEEAIDEATGLSGWSTTTIRKVSSHYEQNQEKKRQRQHEKEVAEYKEKKEKEIQARKMEEAKYANAHDSALGAYNVFDTAASGKGRAYKGVDINKETKMEVADTAKSLSKGLGSVAFKKKKIKKKGNVRKTFADD